MEKACKRRIGLFLLATFWSFDISAKMLLIEDEQTEQYLEEIVRPIFKSASVPFNKNKIHIVQDGSLNAFVSDGNHLFVHTGLLMSAKHSNELEGVLAHEVGHIKAGHIFKQKIKAQEMASASLVSTIVAGAVGAASGRADVGVAALLGSQSSLMSQYFAYRVEDERSADEAAVSLLRQNGKSVQGLADFMKKLKQDSQLSGRDEQGYFRTHPINSERLVFLEQQIKQKEILGEDVKLDIIKAKLFAFLEDPQKTLQKYPNNQYAIAIAEFKQMKIEQALQNLNDLIAAQPSNPFYQELKGQILFESGNAKASVEPYQKALNLLPNSAIFQTNLAMSLLEKGDDVATSKKAISLLKKALVQKKSQQNYLLLAQAYGKIGDEANALLASAEYSLMLGNVNLAKSQAERVKELTKKPQILIKADDILASIEKNI